MEVLPEVEKTFLKFLSRGSSPCDYEQHLLKSQFARVEAVLQGKVVPPYELEIQPSARCNLSCEHCWGKCLKKLPEKLGKNEMKTLAEKVDEFQENGFKIETIKFCGSTGEPLVNPATIAGIEIFKNKRKKLVLFTNGLFLGNMNEKKLYWQYALNLDKINLSLDSGSEETFAELKHCNGYSSIIHSLELMVAEREMRREKTDIVASYVIGRKNRHEILATAKKMKEIGVDEIRFRVDLTDVDGVRDFSGQILDELREAQKLQGDGFRVNSVYSEDEIGEDNSAFNSYGRRCFNHHFWASIGPDCELYSCGHRTRGEVRSYGSILDSNFRSLWLSKERQESTRKLPDEYCAICSPSSVRRNNLMNFLATLSIEEVRRLYKKYVIKQIDKTP